MQALGLDAAQTRRPGLSLSGRQTLQRASAVLPGRQDVVAWVAHTSTALGVPTRLRDIGVAQDALAVIAQKTMGERGLYFNPRPVSHASEILELLQQAY